MARVLLTGFGPFPGVEDNPSEAAVKLIEERGRIGELEYEVFTAILPVDIPRIPALAEELLNTIAPDLAIATGVHSGATGLTFERVAINMADARVPDAAGNRLSGGPVIANALEGRLTTLPVKAMAAAVDDAGIPTTISLSAGAYGCNAVMFSLLNYASSRTRAGFIHIPPFEVMNTDDVAQGIDIAIRTAIATQNDLDLPMGETG